MPSCHILTVRVLSTRFRTDSCLSDHVSHAVATKRRALGPGTTGVGRLNAPAMQDASKPGNYNSEPPGHKTARVPAAALPDRAAVVKSPARGGMSGPPGAARFGAGAVAWGPTGGRPAAAEAHPGSGPASGSGAALVGSRLARSRPAEPSVPPPDLPEVQGFLALLGRAVRQFHTYPPTSALCLDASHACHRALMGLNRRDRVSFRVTPRELVVDDVGVGSGTLIEHELVRRLHRAAVAQVDIHRAALPNDLSRFCTDVNRCDEYAGMNVTLAEQLVEHGVETISLRMAHRPEVLEIGATRPSVHTLLDAERRRQTAAVAAGPATHLYPPEKGWVRLDPAVSLGTVSLIDLAILVEDPGELAAMLLRLSEEEPVGAASREAAITAKFSDVARLFECLDPRLAKTMFARLGRAVLALEPDRRQDLLRRTILPGLLDGRAEGMVLRDFPDVDLAESLFLLLDLETAAPEVLSAALERLDLPAARREQVIPLLETRLRSGAGAKAGRGPASCRRDAESEPARRDAGIERYARKLIQIHAEAGKSFADFAAFDLSLDDPTQAAIAGIRTAVEAADPTVAQLQCVGAIVRLESNPLVIESLIGYALSRLAELDQMERWRDLAAELARYRALADALCESRPGVADAIWSALEAWWTPERAQRVAALYGSGADGRALAGEVLASSGATAAPSFAALVDSAAAGPAARAMVGFLCEHATLLAPALAVRLGGCSGPARRLIIRALGFAGPGYEQAIAGELGHPDDQIGREALRALVRVATAKAAAAVAACLRQ
jgi:hypothetical protein